MSVWDQLLRMCYRRVNPRRARLFGCGCCRQVIERFTRQEREFLCAAELKAEGLLTERVEKSRRVALGERIDMIRRKHEGNDHCLSYGGRYAHLFDLEWVLLSDLPNIGNNWEASDNQRIEVALDVFGPTSNRRCVCAKRSCYRSTRCAERTRVHRWNDGCVTGLAYTIWTDGAYDQLPILADALEDAGCKNNAMIDHCRSDDKHFMGCWVISSLLNQM